MIHDRRLVQFHRAGSQPGGACGACGDGQKPTAVLNARGELTRMSYDDAGALRTVVYNGGEALTVAYDALGRRVGVVDGLLRRDFPGDHSPVRKSQRTAPSASRGAGTPKAVATVGATLVIGVGAGRR